VDKLDLKRTHEIQTAEATFKSGQGFRGSKTNTSVQPMPRERKQLEINIQKQNVVACTGAALSTAQLARPDFI
jgi:hypothetical protein